MGLVQARSMLAEDLGKQRESSVSALGSLAKNRLTLRVVENAPETAEALLKRGELQLKALTARYDMYFQGVERLEPAVPRQQFERLLQHLLDRRVTNTAVNFRIRQLARRYQTLFSKWSRISRQIEDGTFERDVKRARKRLAPTGGTAGRRAGADSRSEPGERARDTEQGIELDIDVIEPSYPASPPDPVIDVYRQVQAARKAAGLAPVRLTPEGMRARLAPRLARLDAKYGAGNYVLAVVDETGSIAIKPRQR